MEVELGNIRRSYWVSFAFSFSCPELYYFGRVGGVGGWLKKVKRKLNSTQDVVEVEVRVELGNITKIFTSRFAND